MQIEKYDLRTNPTETKRALEAENAKSRPPQLTKAEFVLLAL